MRHDLDIYVIPLCLKNYIGDDSAYGCDFCVYGDASFSISKEDRVDIFPVKAISCFVFYLNIGCYVIDDAVYGYLSFVEIHIIYEVFRVIKGKIIELLDGEGLSRRGRYNGVLYVYGLTP